MFATASKPGKETFVRAGLFPKAFLIATLGIAILLSLKTTAQPPVVSQPLRSFDRFIALEGSGDHSAAISLGERGLVWCPGDAQTVYFAPPVAVQVRSAVGSGDATVAAFAHAAAAGLAPQETLRLAAACGAANCLADSPGAVRAEDIQRLHKETRVEILS